MFEEKVLAVNFDTELYYFFMYGRISATVLWGKVQIDYFSTYFFEK